MALKTNNNKKKNSDFSISLQGELVCEILSKLPVKTLMRFKCVCKHWLSLIKDDTYFINLHLTRSKLRPCFALAIPRKRKPCRPKDAHRCYYIENRPTHKAKMLIADLSETTGTIATGATPIARGTVSFNYDGILKPVNGLICFTNTTREYGVCVYNLSTRELSPWIRTAFQDRIYATYSLTYEFGYHPATKEHKVICIWREYNYNGYVNTEVMTVGTNTWRIIGEVPSHRLEETSVYANGCIYWITYDHFNRLSNRKEVLIVAFDVGTEKYKTIAVPKFITDQFGEDYEDVTHLYVLDIHVVAFFD